MPKIVWYEMTLPPPPDDDDDFREFTGDWCPDDEVTDEGEFEITVEDSPRRDDGIPCFSWLADAAADMLQREGVFEPSSSRFHLGMWYMTEGHMDMYSGETSRRSYHLEGFTPQEEWLCAVAMWSYFRRW